jgi:NADH-quinone oxidoreductase subunit C
VIDAGRVRAALGDGVEVEESFGAVCADVPAASWVAALTAVRDELGCTYFDWLTGVDELDDGYSVVAHCWSVEARHGLLVRTRVPRDAATLPTLTGVFAGASWHERETAEMFGIDFTGHPHLVPLLLPDGFDGHPLRKEFVLASRAAKPWPGAKEPGESDADLGGGHGRGGAPGRRKTLPPGVPDPATWGPRPAAGDEPS